MLNPPQVGEIWERAKRSQVERRVVTAVIPQARSMRVRYRCAQSTQIEFSATLHEWVRWASAARCVTSAAD